MNGYQLLAENVFRWEQRGRGEILYPEAVALEPPFKAFPGHRVLPEGPEDDGRRPTFLSKLADGLFRGLQGKRDAPSLPECEEPEPEYLKDDVIYWELRLLIPQDLTVSPEAMKLFLAALSMAHFPLAVEMLADDSGISFQIAAQREDIESLTTQLRIHFPEIAQQAMDDSLMPLWGEPGDETERVVVEFGLEKPFMLSLGDPGKSDPFVGLAGALSSLGADEMGAYQVIFTPLLQPWAEQAMACLTKRDGKPFFHEWADWVKAAHGKMSQTLFGVVVRVAARSPDLDRSWQIVRHLAAPLRLFANQWGNTLVPLSNDGYPEFEHEWDVILRRSRRCGMILSLDELTGLIRFPTSALRASGFRRLDEGTRHALPTEPEEGSVCLGTNEHIEDKREVWLSQSERVCHIHMIGATGKGKSTLLFNLIKQDVEDGAGFALMDPHGDLCDKVLGIIPPSRWDDVILVDPGDEQFVVPFNFLSAHYDFEKTILASDLVAVFRGLSTTWGDQMNIVFANAIRAFLESSQGGTLADVRQFLQDPKWRHQFLKTVQDPALVDYWKMVFPQLGGSKSIGPILTRLEGFLSPKPIRYMVAQKENHINFSDIMDRGKIFIARLAHGKMGKENANLLGALFFAKLQQTAMSRERMDVRKRRPFYVYADEFHNFICPSMVEILTGARKYGIGFVLAHQDLPQLNRDKEVASAVLSASTRVVFKVGDADARILSEGFSHFSAREIQNLPNLHAICRIGPSDNDFNLSIPFPEAMDSDEADFNRWGAIDSSRVRVAVHRADIEGIISQPSESGPSAHGRESTKATSIPDPPSDSGGLSTARDNSHDVANELPGDGTSSDPKLRPREVPFEPALKTSRGGKGGNRHTVLQERIKQAGMAKGFLSEMEGKTSNPKEGVDVWLKRGEFRIACEVSITTSVDHEFGNIEKCLRESFDVIAFISANKTRLRKMAEAVETYFSPADRAKVRCFTPDEFFIYFDTIPDAKQDADHLGAKAIQGWKVKRSFATLSPQERAAKTKAAFDLLAEEMKDPYQ